MSETALAKTPPAELAPAVQEAVLLGGDLERLKPQERVSYMLTVCKTLGLNPLTKPFEFIRLNGKLVMYARKDCTEQLRRLNGISVTIAAREAVDGVYVVTARATDRYGRNDESIGAVPIEGLKGEAKANALMKAETKAKRRVTLSISGLGMLDESEVDSIEGTERPTGRIGKAEVDAHFERLEREAAAKREAANDPKAAEPAPSGAEEPAASTDEPAFRDLVECWSWSRKGNEWVSTGTHPQRTPAQNNAIHALKGELGIEDDEWREKLVTRFNKRSSADLSEDEADKLIDALRLRKERFGTAADKAAKRTARAVEAHREIGEYVESLPERAPGQEG